MQLGTGGAEAERAGRLHGGRPTGGGGSGSLRKERVAG